MKSWAELKQTGSDHYKGDGVEPIDLYRAGGILHDFAIGNIIKYAYRSRQGMDLDRKTLEKNMQKIIHYAELIMAADG